MVNSNAMGRLAFLLKHCDGDDDGREELRLRREMLAWRERVQGPEHTFTLLGALHGFAAWFAAVVAAQGWDGPPEEAELAEYERLRAADRFAYLRADGGL
eukprot:gene16964-57707_t